MTAAATTTTTATFLIEITWAWARKRWKQKVSSFKAKLSKHAPKKCIATGYCSAIKSLMFWLLQNLFAVRSFQVNFLLFRFACGVRWFFYCSLLYVPCVCGWSQICTMMRRMNSFFSYSPNECAACYVCIVLPNFIFGRIENRWVNEWMTVAVFVTYTNALCGWKRWRVGVCRFT